MVPQIRESHYHLDNYFSFDFLALPSPEKSHQPNKAVFQPPSYIIIEHRKVNFDDNVDVCDISRIKEKYHKSLWYSEEEISKFSERKSEKDSQKSQTRRESITYNHSRRVLFHHNAYKQMGDEDRTHGLEYISKQSSKNSKRESRKKALKLEMEVKRYNSHMLQSRGLAFVLGQLLNGLL